jgi:hypothetical protein
MAAFSDFYPLVSFECAGAPHPLIDDAVRRGARAFCEQSHALTLEVTIPTVAATQDYDPIALTASLVTLEAELLDVNFIRRNSADFLTAQSIEYVTSQTAASDFPTMYAILGTNVITNVRKKVRLYPTPSSVESLYFDIVIMPLQTATTLPDILADKYLEGVAAYAKYWLMSQSNKPWSNPNKAEFSYRQFDAKVADARVRKAQGHANIVRHVRMVPFA